MQNDKSKFNPEPRGVRGCPESRVVQGKKKIIDLFGGDEGEFVSGEHISKELGVSRACVWKYVKKLREEGYVVDAVPRRGYRLRSAPDKMYAYAITGGMGTEVFGKRSIHHYESIGSTNDRAYELAETGAEEGTLVLAEAQTRGKGRIGRKWISPPSGGIYMSLILRPRVETDEIPTITLIAGMAVIKAINGTCGLEAGMKWPNDVLVNGKKVCGILTQIKAQPDLVDFLVLGIGINVNTPPEKLPPEGTSLKTECSRHLSRTALIKRVLEDLEEYYFRFTKETFASLRDECRALSLVLGKRVKVEEHHRSLEGVAADIDEKGALIVKTDAGELRRVFSGDVVMCR